MGEKTIAIPTTLFYYNKSYGARLQGNTNKQCDNGVVLVLHYFAVKKYNNDEFSIMRLITVKFQSGKMSIGALLDKKGKKKKKI